MISVRAVLLLALLAVAAADVLTTDLAVGAGVGEKNPVMATVVGGPGVAVVPGAVALPVHLAIKLSFVLAAGVLAMQADRYAAGSGQYCLGCAIGVLGLAVLNNVAWFWYAGGVVG